MSRELGKLTPVPEEAYFIRDTVSKLNFAKYEIRAATKMFPPPTDHASWYVFATELEEMRRTADAAAIWLDTQGNIVIESNYLGNTTDWVGRTYGEEAAISALKLDFTDFTMIRETFAKDFPEVDEHLQGYEHILAEVSSRFNIRLSIRYVGRPGAATFFMKSTINVKGLNQQHEAERIKINLEGLEEAWKLIAKYEANWLEKVQHVQRHS